MAMKVLLQVAREAIPDSLSFSSASSQSASVEKESEVASQPAAVHALNILRALFRDSRLGEHVVPHIPEGVKIAICGFGASLWPVSVEKGTTMKIMLSSIKIRNYICRKKLHCLEKVENKEVVPLWVIGYAATLLCLV